MANDYSEDLERLKNEPPYVKAIQHDTIANGSLHAFGVMFDVRGWGWDYMLDWADYMAKADFKFISNVWLSDAFGEQACEDEYQKAGNSFEAAFSDREASSLSIAGKSLTLNGPLKIVWYNQTNIVEFQMLHNDGVLVAKYAETMIRRSFGTNYAMKVYNDKITVEER